MDYYSQGNVPSPLGKNPTPTVTLDKVCKLLRSAQPIVWSVAIVFGLLGVSLTLRYFWTRKRVQDEESVISDSNPWLRA